ncbi:uncharacterized protein LOC136043974 [Artemia franciscana]|uniref:uncharacterized protein LOC136043974 n=1 Tax=Artemia franciscana TaxID=6661 RepID=UPI0032D9E268
MENLESLCEKFERIFSGSNSLQNVKLAELQKKYTILQTLLQKQKDILNNSEVLKNEINSLRERLVALEKEHAEKDKNHKKVLRHRLRNVQLVSQQKQKRDRQFETLRGLSTRLEYLRASSYPTFSTNVQ